MADNYVIAMCDGCAVMERGEVTRAGWGVVLTTGGVQPTRQRFSSPLEPGATNNYAELVAVIRALQLIQKHYPSRTHVAIYTDSQWVERCFNQFYVPKTHLQAFEMLRKLAASFKHCYLGWVPREMNYDADRLAKSAAHGRVSP